MTTQTKHRSADSPVARQGLRPDDILDLLRSHPETIGLAGTYALVKKMALACETHGGRLYVVGGAVRDEILGTLPRDFDLEVHGLTQEQVVEIARQLGDPKDVGKSFGTILLQTHDGKIDIALPRRDSKTGEGHRDFVVEILPHLGITEGARRREFTIGAIYKDVLSGEIYDPFHGIADLESKTLRMVDANSFGDDALRVLRGVRFAARFELTVDEVTKVIMLGMVEKLGVLKKDRLREEWIKMLYEAKRPSIGIELARELGILQRWYPDLARLWDTPQDPEFHPEGNVGQHTMMVVDEASALTWNTPTEQAQRREIMLAALTHDFGKPSTTKNEKNHIRSKGHEAAGAQPAEAFLISVGLSHAHVHRIIPLVTNHMRPADLYRQRNIITDHALRKLSRDVGPHWLRALVTVAEADHRGRGPFLQADGTREKPNTAGYHAWWDEQIERLHLDLIPEPLVSGHDLVADRQSQGWKPGTLIGEALRLTQELAMSGFTREQLLTMIDAAADADGAVVALHHQVTAIESAPAKTEATDGQIVVARVAARSNRLD